MRKKSKLAIAVLIFLAVVMIYYKTQTAPPQNTPEPAAVAKAATADTSSSAQTKLLSSKAQASVKAGIESRVKLAPTAAVEEQRLLEPDNANYFVGSWCNNEIWKERGEFFSLLISLSEEGETSAIFTNGGPLSEILRMKVSGTEAEFYFVSLGGSLAFSDAPSESEIKDCTEKVASAKLIDDNSLEVANINDVCGHMSAPKEPLVLTRLNDSETCLPDGPHEADQPDVKDVP